MSRLLRLGVAADEGARYATKEILAYFKKNKLSSEQLNATFHKSWKTIKESTRKELLIHQLLHYFTTYGTDFTSDLVYFPAEEFDLPVGDKLPIKLIRGLDLDELKSKSLQMLASGIALDEDTIDRLIELLDVLGHTFTSLDGVKNKEAAAKLAIRTGIFPKAPTEFFRVLVYLGTGSTLLIKNQESIEAIKESKPLVVDYLEQFGWMGRSKNS